jgi:uncharacterized protein
LFQAVSLPATHSFKFAQPFTEYLIDADDGIKLNALFFKAEGQSKGLIVYFHGNADNLQRWGNYAVDFTSKGYDVFMPEYRGYGKSEGEPDEQLCYRDSETIMNWVNSNLKYERIIIYGRSLGAAIASRLAGKLNPDLLFMETPFDEVKGAVYAPVRIWSSVFPFKYEFSNKNHLQKLSCKVIIVHGTDDWVVPLSSAERLRPLLKPSDRFLVIKGGGHRNLRTFPEYHQLLNEALR